MIKNIFLQAYCHCNLGDDLFIRLICQRYPNINFYLMVNPNAEASLKDIPNLHIIRRTIFVRALNKLGNHLLKKQVVTKYYVRKCSIAIILGGSMFIERDNAWKAILREQNKLRRDVNKLAVMGANFGPFHTEQFRREYEGFFAQIDDVCFRDCWSKAQFTKLEKIRYAPDLALTLDPSPFVHKKEKRMTIIPILLGNRSELRQYEEQYIISLASLVRKAVQDDWEVILQSFCQKQGDEQAIACILNTLEVEIRKKVRCSFYRKNIYEPLYVLGSSDVVVTTRFHGMILGWLFGTKVYPIVYSDKMLNYLVENQYKGFYSTIENLVELPLEDVLNENNRVDVTKLKILAEDQFKWLDHQQMSGK